MIAAIIAGLVLMTTGNDDFLAEHVYMAQQKAALEALQAPESDSNAEAEEIPAEDATSPETAARSFYGNCRITFYCSCSACCGQWAGGATASGTTPTAGRTVANGSLPFGTHVLIDGVEYVVEDRGVSGDQFDIFCSSHQEALNRGLYYTDVYIIQ